MLGNLDEPSPLGDSLGRYANFFALFRDFRGHVDLFLLQDLVTDDYGAVRFFTPFEGFGSWLALAARKAYRAYMRHALDFIGATNDPILAAG